MTNESPLHVSTADLAAAMKVSLPREPRRISDWLSEETAERIQLEQVRILYPSMVTDDSRFSTVYQWTVDYILHSERVHIGYREHSADGRTRTEWFFRSGVVGGDEYREAIATLARRNRVAGRTLENRITGALSLNGSRS